MDPDNAWVYRNKGILHLKLNQYEEALRLLKQSSMMDAYVENVFYFLGEANRMTGEIQEACTAYKKSANNLEQEGIRAYNEFCLNDDD